MKRAMFTAVVPRRFRRIASPGRLLAPIAQGIKVTQLCVALLCREMVFAT
jgi:hypothetical protein